MNRGRALRLLLDTDPGVDDAIAILMALAAPGAEVVGLTTVGGNVGRARATRNALALLQAAGRAEVPVARGAARPRLGRFRPSVDVHGPGGLSVRLPNPAAGAIGLDAADFMADRLSAEPGRITIVALGPLTNLSLLEERHPGALGRAAGVVVMGGAVNARGNVTGRAEFNIYSDPLAAAQILESGYAVGLADLAASRQVAVTRGQAGGLSAAGRWAGWRCGSCRGGSPGMGGGSGLSFMIRWRWRWLWIRGWLRRGGWRLGLARRRGRGGGRLWTPDRRGRCRWRRRWMRGGFLRCCRGCWGGGGVDWVGGVGGGDFFTLVAFGCIWLLFSGF